MRRLAPTAAALAVIGLLLAGCDGANSDTAAEQAANAERAVAAGDFHAAVVHLKNAVQVAPEDASYRLRLGHAYLALRDGPSAEKELRRARDLGAGPELVNEPLIRAWLISGHYREAIELIGRTDTGPALKILEARARVGADQLAEARELLEDAGGSADAELARAELALAERTFEDAVAAADRSLSQDPKLYPAMLAKARALVALQRNDEVLPVLDTAEAEAGSDLNVHVLRVLALHGKGDLDAATAALEPLKQRAASAPATRYLVSMVALSKRDFTQAKDAAEAVLGDVPNHTGALLVGGAANAALGLDDTARTQLHRLLALDPNDKRALSLLRQIDTRTNSGASLAATHATSTDPAGTDTTTTEEVDNDSPAVLRRLSIQTVDAIQSGNLDEALKIADEIDRSFPDNAAGPNLKGVILARRNELGAAAAAFGTAVQREPENVSAVTNLAELERGRGQLTEARNVLLAGLETNPEERRILMLLSRVELESGNMADGEAYLKRAVAAPGEGAAAEIALGRYYLARRQSTEALNTAVAALESQPESIQLLEVKALAENQLGDRAAEGETMLHLAKVSGDSQFYRRAALAFLAAEQSERAEVALEEALKANPGFNVARGELIEVYLRKGKLELAKENLDQLTERMPDAATTDMLWGMYHFQQADYPQAQGRFKKTLEQAPSTQVVLALARTHWAAGDRQAAKEALTGWLQAHGEDQQARAELASFLTVDQDFVEAESQYLELVGAGTESPIVYNNLAWVQLQLGKHNEAWRNAGIAFQRAPDSASVLDTYGEIALARGNVPAAIDALEKANRSDPTNPGYGLNLAKALIAGGRKNEARALLERVVGQTEPSSELGAEARATLAKL